MKTKTYPLLQFGDKILSIRETIFPETDRTDVFDAQDAEITTGKGQQYIKQMKNLLYNKQKFFVQKKNTVNLSTQELTDIK